ncbi:hypothetical protein PV367_12915 [Streptomyces europaeiscabiei]|uniref:Uncharacterized protein n=1 Tax=Streptomyces europaeiscabiei TaxID=146819 RepID=A0AAJ2PN81_9ACTN|nr:hypothetical protein [Streptomyces europaeiscabiei]MDX3130670.1 hypothetical protein [Streptomyces europaeiscabiei]
MAQLKIRDLHDLLRQAPRRGDLEQDGIRLVYDGTALHMSTTDAPDTVIARASTCGFTTEPWEVTAYRASITGTEVWLRINSEYDDHLIDVAPFWAQRPAAITFTAGGHTAAFPVIACPTAPSDRRP